MSLTSILRRQDISSETKEAIKTLITELEEEAYRTKTRLEYLLKSGPAIIYSCEPRDDYQTTFMSENVKEILGHNSEDFLYNPSFWFGGVHPEDRQRVIESFSKILDTHFFSEKYRFQHKDGTYRWMLEEANLIHDKQGNPIEIVGYWTDITVQKRAEEQVWTERENLYRILNSTDDLIYIVNPQYEIEFINAAAKKEFGPVEGKKCYEYYNGLNNRCPWCTMERVIGGKTIRREKTLSRNKKTYDMIDTPLKNVNGSISSLTIFRDVTDRKQIEEALKESEENFRELVDLLPVTVFEIDPLGNFIFSNRYGLEISGYTQDDLNQGLNALQLFIPEDREIVKQNIMKILSGEKIKGHEYTALRKDGTRFPVLVYSAPVYRDKRPIKLRGTVVDITQLKETERALRESEEKYRTFVQNFQGIAFSGYEDFSAGFFHGKIEEITGYTKNEFINGEIVFNQLIHPEDIQWVKDDVGEFMSSSQRATQREYRIIDKNGNTHWIHESIQKFFDEKFKKGGVYGTLQDITERKRAEEALRESEEKYRSFIENFQGIAFRGYGDFSQDFFLGKVEELTGYSEDDFLSRKIIFKDLIHPEDSQRISSDVDKFYSSSEELHRREYRILDRYGTVHWFQEDIKKFFNKGKNKTGVYGTIQDITERKVAEEALRESEEKWRTLVENAPDIIFTVDHDGKILFINHPPAGLTVEDAIGTSVYDYIEPKYRKTVKQSICKVYQTGEPDTFEIAARGPYDKSSWYTTRLGPIKHNNEVQAVLLITRDITERKQAEEALKRSEEKYRLLFESAPIGIGISNLEGCVLEANQKILEIMGYTPDEVKTVSLGDNYVNPEDRKELLKVLQESGQIQDFEVQLKRKDGTPYYSILNINLMELGDRKVFLTTQRDLTEWREMDRVKRETEERLRKFMESATDGFTLLDSNLNFIDINRAGLIGLGLSREELIGKNFLDVFPKLQGSETFSKYYEVLKTGNPYYIDDIDSAPRIKNKFYSVRAFKVGEGLGIITTDITDRVKAEKTREELEQRRDSFVWMTTHELRTPLTVLTGYCDFLIEHVNDLTQKRITNILSVIKSNLDRLERLTSKVSTIGQIERGIFEIEKTQMNLFDFLQNTLEPYSQLLGDQFEYQGCVEDPLLIEGDPHRLQQVFDNIMGNAIKQTDKDHRKISVTTEISQSEIRIKILDNGAGIRPENLDIIFEQFVSIPTEYSVIGTGIGLYLCRKTLEAHGGKITAQSKGLGHGATFIIVLPRVVD